MWALLPVKSPSQAKTRLTSVLLDQECAALSWAMLKDMLEALDAAEEIDTIVLLTEDAELIDYGLHHGYQVIQEQSGAGLNASIDSATARLTDAGVNELVILPVDLPTVRASEIDELCRGHRGALTVCPAVRDGGTNALVATPPNAVAAQFGPDSARRFLMTARKNGLSANTHRCAGIRTRTSTGRMTWNGCWNKRERNTPRLTWPNPALPTDSDTQRRGPLHEPF